MAERVAFLNTAYSFALSYGPARSSFSGDVLQRCSALGMVSLWKRIRLI